MVASNPQAPVEPGRARRLWLWILAPLALVSALLVLTCWLLTEPLDDRAPSALQVQVAARPAKGSSLVLQVGRKVPERSTPLAWPEGRLAGEPAKKLLLRFLQAAADRLAQVEGYTATFRKQERIGGELGPEHTLVMKVRNRPFAIYLKYVEPTPGKEVVFCTGRHENKLIAHSTGFSRLLLPRLAVAPDHPLALAESRHPITEAGLVNLVEKLLRFRRLDLEDREAETVLDRATDADGEPVLRSIHKHPSQRPERPFAYIEVLYDPDTWLPVQISSFDWPEPGQTGELKLAERYVYDDLDFKVSLSDLDFDPANPAYGFHR